MSIQSASRWSGTIAPNPRLQRTPSAPLSRKPLGLPKQVIHVGLFALAVLLTNIACNHDLSNLPPYSQYVGKTVTLKRDTHLWRPPAFLKKYTLGDSAHYGDSQDVGRLRAGTTLIVRGTVYQDGIDATYIFAVGSGVDPASRQSVEFEYVWDYYSSDVNEPTHPGCMNRAPWEDETVPAFRYVGADGTAFRDPNTVRGTRELAKGA